MPTCTHWPSQYITTICCGPELNASGSQGPFEGATSGDGSSELEDSSLVDSCDSEVSEDVAELVLRVGSRSADSCWLCAPQPVATKASAHTATIDGKDFKAGPQLHSLIDALTKHTGAGYRVQSVDQNSELSFA